MAAPDGNGVMVYEPDSIDEFPGMVSERLDASS